MFLEHATRLLALVILTLGMAAARAQSDFLIDQHGSRQSLFRDLVRVRSEAIDAAFPGFLAISDFNFVVAPLTTCANRTTRFACYDAVQNRLTLARGMFSSEDRRLWLVAENYWLFYEDAEVRAAFPVIGIIDGALWSAFMSEVAQQHHTTWPHEGCGSIQLDQRLGCEMLVSGVESQLRFRHSRIYNANRLDRLWPDDLASLEQSGRHSRDREYAQVRDLGGVELLQPLIREFGAARVFAYVAQAPFSIEDNDVRKSAVRYQERARRELGW